MKRLSLSVAAAAAIAFTAVASGASASPQPALFTHDAGAPAQLIFGVYSPNDAVTLERTQYFWGGRRYCWYDGGWHGPGYYWCGYAYRRGFGWGGPVGWRGWGGHGFHGGYHGRGYHGGGFHGGHGFAGHGGGFHGGGHGGGGHGGGHGDGGGHHR